MSINDTPESLAAEIRELKQQVEILKLENESLTSRCSYLKGKAMEWKELCIRNRMSQNISQ